MLKKRICALMLVFVLLFSVGAQAISLTATGACSMDAATGEVYYSKNGNTLMTPASLTKVMTLFVVFKLMDEGKFTENTLVPISANAAKLSRGGSASNIPLTAGTSLKMSTLIDAMVIVSACASCTAVGEYISGSEAQFAQLMNLTAAELGIDAYFTDASGLSNYNLISPIGMAQLIREFISRYPRILDYTKKKSANINGRTYTTTNKLIRTSGTNYFYSGADGFKTGTTTLAGSCLAATAKRGNTRIISVTMKASSDYGRYSDSKKLLDDAFYRAETLGAHVFSTDMRVYIDGHEIPCYTAMGNKQELCITAENLQYYGFDINYDSSAETLYLYEKNSKQISPIYEEKIYPGLPLHKTFEQKGLNVVIVWEDGTQHPLTTAISLNGQCAIRIDELGKVYGYNWDDATRTANIYTN